MQVDFALLTAIALPVLGLSLLVRVWQSVAMSVFFARSGSERWRGWLPIVDDLELFRRAELPAYFVGLLFVPFVNVYALVMKWRALKRVGFPYGWRGGAATVGLLFPPVWATMAAARADGPVLQAWTDDQDDNEDDVQRSEEILSLISVTPLVPEAQAASVSAPSSQLLGAAGEGARTAGRTGAPSVGAPPHPEALPAQPAPERREYELLMYGGASHRLEGDRVWVGRAPQSTDPSVVPLRLQDPARTLSKNHAEFVRSGDVWFVIDLGSTNGVRAAVEGDELSLIPARTRVPVTGEVRLGEVRVMIRQVQR